MIFSVSSTCETFHPHGSEGQKFLAPCLLPRGLKTHMCQHHAGDEPLSYPVHAPNIVCGPSALTCNRLLWPGSGSGLRPFSSTSFSGFSPSLFLILSCITCRLPSFSWCGGNNVSFATHGWFPDLKQDKDILPSKPLKYGLWQRKKRLRESQTPSGSQSGGPSAQLVQHR